MYVFHVCQSTAVLDLWHCQTSPASNFQGAEKLLPLFSAHLIGKRCFLCTQARFLSVELIVRDILRIKISTGADREYVPRDLTVQIRKETSETDYLSIPSRLLPTCPFNVPVKYRWGIWIEVLWVERELGRFAIILGGKKWQVIRCIGTLDTKVSFFLHDTKGVSSFRGSSQTYTILGRGESSPVKVLSLQSWSTRNGHILSNQVQEGKKKD